MNELHGKEFIIGVSHNRKGNLGYGDSSKYLAYSIESQVVGFGIQASLVESSFRWAAGLSVLGKVSGGAHSKQIYKLVRACQNYIL